MTSTFRLAQKQLTDERNRQEDKDDHEEHDNFQRTTNEFHRMKD